MTDGYREDLASWEDLIEVERVGPLEWELGPSDNWSKGAPFAFHFHREVACGDLIRFDVARVNDASWFKWMWRKRFGLAFWRKPPPKKDRYRLRLRRAPDPDVHGFEDAVRQMLLRKSS